eukprot:m.58572 g.58572  ORF g.58572 m.58572 type:complete len:657 (+) comp7870_c0_seq1:95-2065(+)
MLILTALILLLVVQLMPNKIFVLVSGTDIQKPSPDLLARNDSFQLSYEGSWSFVTLDPENSPSSMGSLGYRLYSDWFPAEPLFKDILSTSTSFPPPQNETDDCTLQDYTWRPDYATTTAICGGVTLNTTTWYQHDRQVCSTISFTASYDQILFFSGMLPNHETACTTNHTIVGRDIFIDTLINSDRDPYHETFKVSWLVQSSLDQQPQVNNGSYYWHLTVLGGTQNELNVCITELEDTQPKPQPVPFPPLNMSATTNAVQSWLDEAAILPSNVPKSTLITYYTAWFQFWFNTERAGGNWIKPIITPSMSHYGRGMWLWDSGFHVFALLSGGPHALEKAKDQLAVLLSAGATVGHIPRVVGVNTTENTTQPPGILTWASLLVYNRTHDEAFLQQAFRGFSQNNNWFYAARGSPNSELCMWQGTDSGWDNSPRWDLGSVEAIDLNGWMYMDQRLLASMASTLKDNQNATKWNMLAATTKSAVQKLLWDVSTSMYWDRLPHPQDRTSPFRKVVTPAPFWSLLAGIATKEQAVSITSTLLTTENLKTPFFMPCVGRSQPQFDPNDYWRGPVWINVNWLSAVGLECYGMSSTAQMLRKESISLVNSSPTPREYYNPLNETGLGAYNFMWTGAVYIIMQQEQLGNFQISNLLHQHLACSNSN